MFAFTLYVKHAYISKGALSEDERLKIHTVAPHGKTVTVWQRYRCRQPWT